ncbi:MAG: GNAT family N-acetyltransferase [Culicoidibacterales bacterium]
MAGQEIIISLATEVDSESVRHLLVERAQWLSQQGKDQWQQFATYEQTQQIQIDYQRKVLYVAKLGAECVGAIVITLAQDFDEQLWEQAEGYLYIHRYVVSLQVKGKGIGSKLLDFAKQQAKQQKLGLRLDCRANNTQLVAYYQNQGWRQKMNKNGYARFEWDF